MMDTDTSTETTVPSRRARWRRWRSTNGLAYKKLGVLMGVAFVLFFVVQPQESAGYIRDALTDVGNTAAKLADFVKALVA
jgi:hypothetical protein